jgi:glutamate 5-kinase
VSHKTTLSQDRASRLIGVRRLVVKVGSSSITTHDNQLNRPAMRSLVTDIASLREKGYKVAIVSSGAVAAGIGRLGLKTRPRAISELQAVAAIGQNLLMHTYESMFRRMGVPIGQVLLTADDILHDRRRYLNLENTFRKLFRFDAIPVINENDSIAVAELKLTIGENDMLAAYVSNLIGAHLLVILSDVEGVYAAYDTTGPSGKIVAQIEAGDERLEKMTGVARSRTGSGGMETKIRAARLLMACGEMTLIAHARKHRLLDILAGEDIGTLFIPKKGRLRSRKRWIAFASSCKGHVVVDHGAERALTRQGKSLLPAGVVSGDGAFEAGDVVRIENPSGADLGRGLSRYSLSELAKICGKSSEQVATILNRQATEVIHRDDLVLF